ncbi:ABC-type multidrug transport system fused ATPase/permease subunit [Stackebrandtia endophytica]|uniref:ABC-type multidrug transport system fused ATPase/permease subunit n=2 Tax=Stackebrandtia endophytica TaxID=1496996 RepID=A0A543B3F8_9ACTN|nr:ABC transporter ATP-binding protein [Stackebrandtia endophytica]TQL79310.1 ABC-type multidrug transport system fused ATPase/permease subunit [Stackebrandtia endophytica]
MDGAIPSRGVIKRGMRVLWMAVKKQPGSYALATFGAIMHSTLVLAGAFVSARIVDQVVVPSLANDEVAVGALWLAVVVLVLLSLFKIIGMFIRRLGAGAMQFRLQADHRREVTRRYLDLPVSWHQKHQTGSLLSNANADVEASFVPIAPLPFASGTLVMLLTAMIALFWTDWALALVGLGVFPLLFAFNVMYARRMSPRMTRAQQLRADVSAVGHESFDGALVVKTMGREAEETVRFNKTADQLRDSLISVGRLRGLFDPIMSALPELGTLVVLVVGAWRLSGGVIGLEEIVRVTMLFSVLAFPIRAITWVLADLPRSVVGWERVYGVLSAEGDMEYGTKRLPRDGGPATLKFRDVDFSYETNEVLKGVTFDIPSGKTVALVGPTGSGKSTIASLATRLIDPAGGQITIDGVDVREMTHASLAETTALVPQLAFVFDDTIRGNIALQRHGVDDEMVWRALRTAQADGFVAQLDDGLDTEVGERGTSLSGGQRQRLTLGRALAGTPRLLIMDDATSAVDPKVEAAILDGLKASEQPASVLVVAYRRATIALADEVVYLEHGRVIARGTHTELLNTVPGYANLVTAYERAEAERAADGEFDETDDWDTADSDKEVSA